jgi:signal transduction histidine kinase
MLLSATSYGWFVILGSAFSSLLVIYIFMLFYEFRKKRALHIHEVQKKFEQTILQSQIEIQEHTFTQISQEIHDNIGQLLSLARLNVNTLEQFSEEKVSLIDELLERAIQDLRHLSHHLNSTHIKEIGLIQAVSNLLNSLKKTGQFSTTFNVPNTELIIPEENSIIIYRIVQEIIQNIVKHARATNVVVTLDGHNTLKRIIIEDNGKGFDTDTLSKTSGVGIRNIINRASVINCKLQFDSIPDKGTTVTIYT